MAHGLGVLGKADAHRCCAPRLLPRKLPAAPAPGCAAEVPVPAELQAQMEAKRAELVEAVAEVDEALAEHFVLEEPIDGDTLRAAVRRWVCPLRCAVLCRAVPCRAELGTPTAHAQLAGWRRAA